jgi:ribosomal protein S18 acetylase RimI-like enzyme
VTHPTGLHIRRLAPADAEALVKVRREALLTEPLAFGAADTEELALLTFARRALGEREQQAVFGQVDGGELAGMVGVIRVAGLKEQHKSYVWGMYVAPRARGQGVGRALMQAAIGHARGWPGVEQVQLSVTEASASARRLYVALGFRRWGTEPRALCWEGRYLDEEHLVLHLREPG